MEQNRPQAAGVKAMDYYDANGKVRMDLFSVEAEKIGKDLINKTSNKFKGRGSVEISVTQLRKFFDDVKAVQRYLYQFEGEAREDAFRRKLPEIMMLKAKVSYARGRDTVTEEFREFIEKNMDAVKNIKDFEVFCKFFEAVYGYFCYHTATAQAQNQKR